MYVCLYVYIYIYVYIRIYMYISIYIYIYICMYVVVNFLSQVIFIFPLFLGMVIYANEFETKEKQKLPELKN